MTEVYSSTISSLWENVRSRANDAALACPITVVKWNVDIQYRIHVRLWGDEDKSQSTRDTPARNKLYVSGWSAKTRSTSENLRCQELAAIPLGESRRGM